MHQPVCIGRNSVSERDFYLLSVPSISDGPGHLGLASKYFGVLLACDARDTEDAVVVGLARSLIAQGMRYFCSWGNDCERIHDLVDSVIVENDPDETDDSVIITMWLENERLDEALWQFLYVAFPANDYAEDCHADLAIIVGNEEWAKHVRNRLSDLSVLNRVVVGEDATDDVTAI